MAATITVKVGYTDRSKSLTLSYGCADSHPSGEIIKDCEVQAVQTWQDAGNGVRDLTIHTTVKRV